MRYRGSITTKLVAGLAFLGLLVAALGGLSISEMEEMHDAAVGMRDVRVPATEALGYMGLITMRQRVNGNRIITADTPELRAEVATTIVERNAELDKHFRRYEALPLSDNERSIYGALRQRIRDYGALQQQALDMAKAGDRAGAQLLYNTTMSKAINAVTAEWDKLVALNVEATNASGAQIGESYAEAEGYLYSIGSLAILGLVAVATLAIVGIARPLHRLTGTLTQLATGDLAVTIPYAGRRDEIGAIAGRIRELDGVASSIASSFEQQSTATAAIARNVSEAATGTGAATSNVGELAEGVSKTGTVAAEVLSSASVMSRQSEQLATEVARFVATLEAA